MSFRKSNYIPPIFAPLPSECSPEDADAHATAIFQFFDNIVGEGAPQILRLFADQGISKWLDGDMEPQEKMADRLINRASLLYRLTSLHHLGVDAEELNSLRDLILETLDTSQTFVRILAIPELSYWWVMAISHHNADRCKCGGAVLRFMLDGLRAAWSNPRYHDPKFWGGDSEQAEFRRRVLKTGSGDVERIKEWPLEAGFWERVRQDTLKRLQLEYGRLLPQMIPLPPISSSSAASLL